MTEAMPERVLDKLVGRIPLRRMGEPADVADAVAHLLSDEAAYVTGQTVYVCGGRSL
jgi:3-oxoacyl-[acyl-carrier protein] reductase